MIELSIVRSVMNVRIIGRQCGGIIGTMVRQCRGAGTLLHVQSLAFFNFFALQFKLLFLNVVELLLDGQGLFVVGSRFIVIIRGSRHAGESRIEALMFGVCVHCGG